jgi:hypothetical protein
MTSATLDTPTSIVLTPTGNSRPVEKAVVDGIADDFGPETHLWIVFRTPEGGARVYYAWTAGGQQLGDKIDREAVARGFDLTDWLFVPGRYRTEHVRGRVTTQAYPLRPILADVLNNRRAVENDRARTMGILDAAADLKGQERPVLTDFLGPWGGVGPAMLGRSWSGR